MSARQCLPLPSSELLLNSCEGQRYGVEGGQGGRGCHGVLWPRPRPQEGRCGGSDLISGEVEARDMPRPGDTGARFAGSFLGSGGRASTDHCKCSATDRVRSRDLVAVRRRSHQDAAGSLRPVKGRVEAALLKTLPPSSGPHHPRRCRRFAEASPATAVRPATGANSPGTGLPDQPPWASAGGISCRAGSIGAQRRRLGQLGQARGTRVIVAASTALAAPATTKLSPAHAYGAG